MGSELCQREEEMGDGRRGSGGGGVNTVRAGAGAAVGVVAELVDVPAALGGGVIAGDVVGDGCWGAF